MVKTYSVGDEITISFMKDEPGYDGKKGVITHTDDMGQLHGTWGGCALIPDVDDFCVSKKKEG